MNNVIYRLVSIPGLRKICIVWGTDFSLSLFEELLSQNVINYFDICYETASLCKKHHKQIECLSKKHNVIIKERSFDKKSGLKCDVLLFSGLSNIDFLDHFTEKKLSFLIGNVYDDYESSFRIWEKFRLITKNIYIANLRNDQPDEILSWSRDDKCDTELSVIFPMYNISQYLDECVNSILKWDAEYVEYIFVDDGSPDNSADIIRRYSKKDKRIKLLTKENGGCASARQYGVDHSHSRYIGFVDPDDFIDGSMFRKLFYRAMVGTYDVCFCGYKEKYEDSSKIRDVKESVLDSDIYICGTTDRKMISDLLIYLRIAIWRGIYKRNLLIDNDIRFYEDLKRFDDLPFKFEIYSCAKSVVCVSEYLYYYRMQRPGQDVSADDERLFVHFEIFDHLDCYFEKHGSSKIYDYLQVCKLQTHIFGLMQLKPELYKAYLKMAKQDLLKNMDRYQMEIVFKQKVGKRDYLFYKAIMHQNRFMVYLLKKGFI